MHYRILGRTGLRVSVIGIGTWQFGGEWGVNFSQTDADEVLDAAAECDINLIDTAECYGDHLSEKLIGDYLARRDRSRWIVATKFGHHFDGFLQRRDDFTVLGVRRQLEDSLRALQIDAIDLYQFHSGSDESFHNDELWTMLDEQKRAGKIQHLGVSINKTSEIQASEAAHCGIGALQVVYNRLDQRSETVHFPFALRDNLGVLARVPLASGFLSGKYSAGATFPADDVRARLGAARIELDLREVERLRQVEVPPGMPMDQWAIAWCLRHPAVTAVIPGCKNGAQVHANALAAEVE